MGSTTKNKVEFGKEIFSNDLKYKRSLSTFGKCLKYVRENRFLCQEEFGIIVDVARSLISRYERDLDIPNNYVLNKIYKPLSVNEIDFLRKSLKNNPVKESLKLNDKLFDKNLFAIRLKKIRHIKNLSQVDLSKISGIYHGNIAKYERCYSIPSLKNIILLADSLGVTIDLLLRGENTNTNTRSLIDSSLIQTFNQLSYCNEEQKKAVILILDSAIKNFR